MNHISIKLTPQACPMNMTGLGNAWLTLATVELQAAKGHNWSAAVSSHLQQQQLMPVDAASCSPLVPVAQPRSGWPCAAVHTTRAPPAPEARRTTRALWAQGHSHTRPPEDRLLQPRSPQERQSEPLNARVGGCSASRRFVSPHTLQARNRPHTPQCVLSMLRGTLLAFVAEGALSRGRHAGGGRPAGLADCAPSTRFTASEPGYENFPVSPRGHFITSRPAPSP
jgi:hypothetical protein